MEENNKDFIKESLFGITPCNTFTNFDNNPKWEYLTKEQIIEKYGDRLTEEKLQKLKNG